MKLIQVCHTWKWKQKDQRNANAQTQIKQKFKKPSGSPKGVKKK